MRKSESYRSNSKEHIIDFAKLQGERWGEVVSGKASVRSQELGVGGRVLSSAFVVRSSKLGVREQSDKALRSVDGNRCVASSFHMTRSPPRRVRFFSVHLHSGHVKTGSVSIKRPTLKVRMSSAGKMLSPEFTPGLLPKASRDCSQLPG